MSWSAPDRRLFDAWSTFYDLPWVQRATYRPIQDAVVRVLREGTYETLLDVGCGTGKLIARLTAEMPALRTVGCDFSAGMLAHAHARRPRASWVRGDACRLPFADHAFDVVVSTEAFHWFPDQDAALHEFRRVLRPRGLLLLALVNPRLAAVGTAARVLSQLIGEPFRWPTADAMRARVERDGFRVVRQEHVFRLPGIVLFPPVLTIATPAKAVSRTRQRRAAPRSPRETVAAGR
jgi:SAM-dependent methyltransferase